MKRQFNISCLPGLDGAAFASRMPANKLTQMEAEIFTDVAHGSQSAIMEFLFIRNKLLHAWLADPANELTAEKAQAAVVLPQAGKWVGGDSSASDCSVNKICHFVCEVCLAVYVLYFLE